MKYFELASKLGHIESTFQFTELSIIPSIKIKNYKICAKNGNHILSFDRLGDAYFIKAELFDLKHDSKKAQKYYNKVIKFSNDEKLIGKIYYKMSYIADLMGENVQKCIEFLKTSAIQCKYLKAFAKLSEIYYHLSDLDNALYWAEQNKNDISSQYLCLKIYEQKKNHDKIFEILKNISLLRKVKEHEIYLKEKAILKLGECYEYGIGTDINLKKAINYYLKITNSSYTFHNIQIKAWKRIAYFFDNGIECSSVDRKASFIIYRRLANSFYDDDSKLELAKRYFYGDGTNKNVEGIGWFFQYCIAKKIDKKCNFIELIPPIEKIIEKNEIKQGFSELCSICQEESEYLSRCCNNPLCQKLCITCISKLEYLCPYCRKDIISFWRNMIDKTIDDKNKEETKSYIYDNFMTNEEEDYDDDFMINEEEEKEYDMSNVVFKDNDSDSSEEDE